MRGFFTIESDGVTHLGHGVGVGAVGDGRGRWAVGCIRSHDLGGVGDIVVGCIRTGHEGSGSNDGGRTAHFDGINVFLLLE